MRLGAVRLGCEFILGVHDAPSKARHAHAVKSSNREKPKCIYFDASDDFGEEAAKRLQRAHRASSLLLNMCFRWLRLLKPNPARCMLVGESLATAEDTHAAWCRQLRDQSPAIPTMDPLRLLTPIQDVLASSTSEESSSYQGSVEYRDDEAALDALMGVGEPRH